MTKKHYVYAAALIRREPVPETRALLVRFFLALVLAHGSEQFDQARFLAACAPEKGKGAG